MNGGGWGTTGGLLRAPQPYSTEILSISGPIAGRFGLLSRAAPQLHPEERALLKPERTQIRVFGRMATTFTVSKALNFTKQ